MHSRKCRISAACETTLGGFSGVADGTPNLVAGVAVGPDNPGKTDAMIAVNLGGTDINAENFLTSLTDLNVTAHLPVFTEGDVQRRLEFP